MPAWQMPSGAFGEITSMLREFLAFRRMAGLQASQQELRSVCDLIADLEPIVPS